MTIKFSMAVIFVKDISISKDFYQDIFSLEIEADFGANVSFKNAFAIWQKIRAEEIIFGTSREEKKENIKHTELYFETSDIETISQKIVSKKVKIIHKLKEEPWGQRTLRFYDPDRFIIEVAEPMDDIIIRLSKLEMTPEDISEKTQMPLDFVKKIIKENS